MKLLICYGTRPEWIKVKPLIDLLKNEYFDVKVLFTGQHDKNIETDFVYDDRLFVLDGKNRLDSIVKSICDDHLFNLKIKYGITHVLVQGDTTTAMAIAISALNNQIKVIHLEAGLRTNDNQNPYPEEQNRRIIGQIADIHLCPTEYNKQNLLKENITNNIFVVGNTAIDNLVRFKKNCRYENKILVTLHRRENHDIINKWFEEIEKLALRYTDYEFLIPLHPNPNVQKYKDILKSVKIVAPMKHEDMLKYLVNIKMAITDSGGLQEECSYFNKKCLTCRIVTERPESIGTSTHIINAPDDLGRIFDSNINDYNIEYPCPYGKGDACKNIYKVLKFL